jgi:isoleucyl-tRNA synthetase
MVCKKNNIESQKALNNIGLFKEEFDFIAGLPPIKADPLVMTKLIETKSLVNNEDYFHSLSSLLEA